MKRVQSIRMPSPGPIRRVRNPSGEEPTTSQSVTMKQVPSTPMSTPVLRNRVRTLSGGEHTGSALPSKAEITKISLERELEILEKLQNNDFDRSAGTEQWFPPSHPTIKMLQHPNLTKLHGLFGSVPVNLGQMKNNCQTLSMHQKFNRGQISSDPDLNICLDNNLCTRKLFGKSGPGSNGSVFSSPTDSTESYGEEIQEEVEDNPVAAFEAYVAAEDRRNEARRGLMKEMHNNKGIPLAVDVDEFGHLVRKIQDINSSFDKLKMNDRLGSIDINKLYPSFENSTSFLQCPIGEQRHVLNCLYSTSDLCQTISNLEKEVDFSEIASKDKLCYLEKAVHDLQGLLSAEEKETGNVKEELDLKTKVLSSDEHNECSDLATEDLSSISGENHHCNKSFL